MWKTCFSASQNAKNECQLQQKTKGVTVFYWQLVLRVWRIILVLTWRAHKRQTFTLILIKLMWIWNFFLHVTVYLKAKESFPICMFVVMASGECELHTYFTFLQRILTSTHMKKINIFLHNICRDVQHSLFRSR